MIFTLEELKQQYNTYAQENPFQYQPSNLYEPVDYILNIGGKRLRPVLVLLGCNLFSKDIEKALPAAYAIEIFHNFSLVHDDIMDEAPLRRGKTTVHKKWDINTAILSGDVMLIYSYEYLLKSPIKDVTKLVKVFNKIAIGVCEGQQFDMDFETAETVTIEEYLKMIELKTSVLLEGAFSIGALIGGASEENAHHIGQFGRNIGIAFQLQDDILDTYGDPEKFGKKVGGDIAQNKKTYLYLKALELADKSTYTQLKKLYSDENNLEEMDKIEGVKAIFNQLEIPKYASQKKAEYIETAYKHLAAIDVPDTQKAQLKAFAKYLVEREV